MNCNRVEKARKSLGFASSLACLLGNVFRIFGFILKNQMILVNQVSLFFSCRSQTSLDPWKVYSALQMKLSVWVRSEWNWRYRPAFMICSSMNPKSRVETLSFGWDHSMRSNIIENHLWFDTLESIDWFESFEDNLDWLENVYLEYSTRIGPI